MAAALTVSWSALAAWPHWLIVLILLPLGGAVLTPALYALQRRLVPWWALLVAGLTALTVLPLLWRLAHEGPFSYLPGGWARPYGVELRFDEFAALLAAAVALLAPPVLLFSRRYAARAVPAGRLPFYYTLLLLNLGGLLGLAITADLFNLFVFLEVVSLSAYALVAVGGRPVAELAAFKYLLMGAISSLLILLAVGILFALTGSLNMADVAQRLPALATPAALTLAAAALLVGFMLKAALFPLHNWLPEAHASAPGAVSAVLSGLVVKAGIIGLVRTYQLFAGVELLDTANLGAILVWLGAASVVMGSFFAVFQHDLKLMLAYSTITNIGYIVMGWALASPQAMLGASLHLFNHALIKTTLFLAAGALIYRTGLRTLEELRGIGRTMPLNCAALALGALAIVGVPPTAGFVGKWFIALGALQAGRPFFALVVVFGALLAAVYYVRIINAFYFREPEQKAVVTAREVPWSMLAPVLLLALLCLGIGLLARLPVEFLEPAVARLLDGRS
ncbi:complex I subunit 5 family protein [Desulfurivibrio dismutans]|uniref:complex I subunit 5 family protein n=1 Tax=Desulfurivibrio dismutans TaxID=1398908 RepID=UPI0023D9C90E|nr:proton-conducting transporter membrane subunit [Desulfurivibrio alkaliphilus]MDF1614418.1 proton-conducting transporter membrane subunit [Desulfurivibrio alkaliphilus]